MPTEAREIAPVAEVVERLREAADNIERARMSGIVENLAGWEQRAVREAAECIAHLNAERLSRERDTGVPEGFWLAPIRPTDEIMTAAAEAHFGKRRTAQSGGIDGIGMTVDGRDLSFRDAFKSFWKGARSAAPQPPTVSTQGWQDISTAPKDRLIDIWIKTPEGGVRWSECYHDSICDEWRTSRPSGKLVFVKARSVTHWRMPPPPPAPVSGEKEMA